MRQVDELVQYCEENAWPPKWPAEMVRRFLTDLVSSEDLVFDLRPDAVAVLVDKVSNPGNHASLEFLGVHGPFQPTFEKVFALAKERLPAKFAGLEVALPMPMDGLEPYYEVFGMLNEEPSAAEPPPPGICAIVTDRDEEELYALLVKCFSQNVDTSIPPFAEWQANRRAPSRSKTWGVWEDKKLVSFLHLSVPRAIAIAEIRTLGTDPEYRGKGYAKALIRRALGYVTQLEISRCALTVTTTNADALGLYRGLGFDEVEHQRIYRWRR